MNKEIIYSIHKNSGEEKLIELLNTQAEMYEYLAGKGEDDSQGVEIAQKYTNLINEVNSSLNSSIPLSNSPSTTNGIKFDPLPGEQLLELIGSKI